VICGRLFTRRESHAASFVILRVGLAAARLPVAGTVLKVERDNAIVRCPRNGIHSISGSGAAIAGIFEIANDKRLDVPSSFTGGDCNPLTARGLPSRAEEAED